MTISIARSIAPLCLAAAAISLAGCGFGHKQTVYTGNGTVTVSSDGQDGDNKTVTVNGKDGSMTLGTGTVDASKLGAPVYPGATADQNGALSMASDKGTSVTAVYKTADDFSKVESFYKSQLPANSEKMNMSTGTGSLATFQVGDENGPETTTVTITSKQGDQTSILLSHVTKNGGAAASAAPDASMATAVPDTTATSAPDTSVSPEASATP